MNTNFDDVEAVVNALTADNLSANCVTKAKLNTDVIRSGYGLSQHTDYSLQVDVSDTNPCLEISDGGVRAKVDDSSIERASGGLQVKALGITNAMLAGSIEASKLAGSIADNLLNQLTTANKVAGSAVQLASSGGIEDDSGLKVSLSIYDFGSSSSSYTTRTFGNLKICFGRVANVGSSGVTITNLPFTSVNSYVVTTGIGKDTPDDNYTPSVVTISASSFSVSKQSGGTFPYVNWIAIGT